MNVDITYILDEWDFDPDDQYRVVQARDGREVLQVRQPLGIEQYELDGRPDGGTPFGKASVLDEMTDRLSAHRRRHGKDTGFEIDEDDFGLLQNEGILFYYRYFVLFQIGDYERTWIDTNHNLKICELVERYAHKGVTKDDILQYRPYILRMNATSRAMVLLEEGLHPQACAVMERAIKDVQRLQEVDTPAFHFERVRSLQYLRAALREVKVNKVHPPVDRLRTALREAVNNEEYERAAQLRDRIRDMTEANDD